MYQILRHNKVTLIKAVVLVEGERSRSEKEK